MRAPAQVALPNATFSVIDFLLDPAGQFPRLVAKPRFVAPMAVLVCGTMALHAACYARLDYAWFTDHLLAAHPGVARLAPPGTFRLDRQTVLGPAVVLAGLGALAAWIATALYVLVLGAASTRSLSFRQALALAAWTRVPDIVALLPSAAHLALHADGRLAPEQMDPATVAMLTGPWSDPFLDTLAAHIGFADLWAWTLLAVGLQRVMSLRWSTSIAAVAVPALLLDIGLAAVAAATSA